MKSKRMSIFIVICMMLLIVGCMKKDILDEGQVTDAEYYLSENEIENDTSVSQENVLEIPNETNVETSAIESVEIEAHIYQQNDAYKIFYGKWEVTEVISQHRLGGDVGYEDIIGRQIVYLPEVYECNGISIENPNYLMTIFPADCPQSFVDDFIVLNAILPDSEYYVWVQIVDKPIWDEGEYDAEQYGIEPYIGSEFFVVDDNTLYCMDYNCLYKLTRVSYMEGYNKIEATTYQER